MRVDLHSHSTVSDGLDSPSALARRMSLAGVEAFALTDGEMMDATVATENLPLLVDDDAIAAASARALRHECGIVMIRDEADLLAVRLVGDG